MPHYFVSTKSGQDQNLVKIKAGKTTTIHLEQVDFPTDAQPADIRVILDLTDSSEVGKYLLSMYAIDSMSGYDFERARAPKTPENEKFFTEMENAQRPADLLNVAVMIDSSGYPAFWNLWHGFVKGTDSCGTACIWAGETGHFVAVLPGSVFTILDWSGTSYPVPHRGVRSRPQLIGEI